MYGRQHGSERKGDTGNTRINFRESRLEFQLHHFPASGFTPPSLCFFMSKMGSPWEGECTDPSCFMTILKSSLCSAVMCAGICWLCLQISRGPGTAYLPSL